VSTVIGAEATTIFGSLIQSDAFETLIDARQKAGLRADLGISARDYLDAMRLRGQIQEAFRAIFGGVAVMVGVGRGTPASRLDEPLDRRSPSLNPVTPPPGRQGNPAL